VRIGRRDLLRAGAVLGAATLTGCTTRQGGTPVAASPQGERPPGEKLPGAVTLGVFEYRPYAYKDDAGELTGEVVEVVRAICDELGIALTIVLGTYDSMLTRVAAGSVDVVGGLSIRAQNCEVLAFTVPDHVSLTALVVPKGNPKGIETFTEVASTGARLAVLTDSLEVGTAEVAGVRNIRVHPSAESMLQAVAAGEADCAAYDDITLRDLLTGKPGLDLRAPFEPPAGAPRYGYGFRKDDDPGLRDAFDAVLRDIHDNGTWLRIAEPFGFTERNLPATERVSDEACAR
jgi:polar amino acid transport system substrate-binding protein